MDSPLVLAYVEAEKKYEDAYERMVELRKARDEAKALAFPYVHTSLGSTPKTVKLSCGTLRYVSPRPVAVSWSQKLLKSAFEEYEIKKELPRGTGRDLYEFVNGYRTSQTKTPVFKLEYESDRVLKRKLSDVTDEVG